MQLPQYGFLDLPAEVVYNIAEKAGSASALRLSQCCRELRRIVSSNALWHAFCVQRWPHRFLNAPAYGGNYEALYRDGNGWFPRHKTYKRHQSQQHHQVQPPEERVQRPKRTAQSVFRHSLESARQKIRATHRSKIPPAFETPCATSSDDVANTTSAGSAICTPPPSDVPSRRPRSRLERVLQQHHPIVRRFSDPNLALPSGRYLAAAVVGRRRQKPLPVDAMTAMLPTTIEWQPRRPKFAIRWWKECPRSENVMDLRITSDTVVSVTAGWHPDDLTWTPEGPMLLNGRGSTPRRPEAPLNLDADPVRLQNGEAQICIRGLPHFELQQRLSFPTPCINCLDCRNVDVADPHIFVMGDDSGTISVLRRRSEGVFILVPTTARSNQQLVGASEEEDDAAVGTPSHDYATKEVNDLRLTREEDIVIAVRTYSRYPSCVEVRNLTVDASEYLTPTETEGFWIHAIELTAVGDTSDIVAAGESSVNGVFAVLGLDLRTRRRVVSVCPQARQMIWPLRVSDNYVFGNAVVPIGESGGFITQYDRRKMRQDRQDGWRPLGLSGRIRSPSVDSSTLEHVVAAASQRTSDEVVRTFPCGTFRTEDFRCLHDHLYVYGFEGSMLRLYRSNFRSSGHRELLTDVDALDASGTRLGHVLKLFQCTEHGWLGTYGATVYGGEVVRAS